MIKPRELESDKGRDLWDMITAAAAGDTPTLRRLLERDPSLSQAEYWYTQPIHFAVRQGHLDAVQILLEAGADPEWNGYHDGSLIEMARDRGHEHIAQLLEEARRRRGRVAPAGDHPIQVAAEADDVQRVRKFLAVNMFGSKTWSLTRFKCTVNNLKTLLWLGRCSGTLF
jgi:hypothetical protein